MNLFKTKTGCPICFKTNNSGKYYFKSSIDDSDKYSEKPSGSNTVIPGKLVAMLPGDSTESSPKLFFAKVIEINTITKMALLNESLETSSGHYCLGVLA